MSFQFNKAQIAGNLTRDPELKTLPSGTVVVNFSIATNRRYRDKNDEWVDAVDYVNCVMFGVRAETMTKWFKKGSPIFVEGRLQTSNWEKDGHKFYKTEIICSNWEFTRSGDNTGQQQAKPATTDPAPTPPPDAEPNPENIPF